MDTVTAKHLTKINSIFYLLNWSQDTIISSCPGLMDLSASILALLQFLYIPKPESPFQNANMMQILTILQWLPTAQPTLLNKADKTWLMWPYSPVWPHFHQ